MNDIPKPASPLPWVVSRTGHLCDGWPVVLLRDGSLYFSGTGRGQIARPSGPREDAARNAAYLVWAANNAQALYELLSRVCKYLDESDIEADSPVHADIAAALKAARGEA